MGGGSTAAQERTLVMFAKFPEPGHVKTRLALGESDRPDSGLKTVWHRTEGEPIGDRRAFAYCADLYRAFLLDRVAAHTQGTYTFLLGISDTAEKFHELFGPHINCFALQGDNMGDLLKSTFQRLLPGRVLITASDYPVLDEAIVEDAFAALDRVDVVLVPAVDGAYNLIGMRTFHDLFDLSAWSSGRELEETEALLQSRDVSYEVLRQHVIRDVDTLDDLGVVMQDLNAKHAPQTHAQLRTWSEELALTE